MGQFSGQSVPWQQQAQQQQAQQQQAIPEVIKQIIAAATQPQQGASTPPAQVQQQIGAMNVPAARQQFVQKQGQGDQGSSDIAAIHEVMKKQKHGDFLRKLFKLGVPVGAAAVGLASKGALPAAAGLSSGFVGQYIKQDEKAVDDAEKLKREGLDQEAEKQQKSWQTALEIAKKQSDLGESIDLNKVKELADSVYKVQYGDAAKAGNAKAESINSGSQDEQVLIKFNDGSTHPMSMSQARAQGYTK